MDIKIAEHLGICGGVRRALDIVEKALAVCCNEKLYVYHEIVHNNFVINTLKQRNVVFVNSVDEIPDGAVAVFSAHGVRRDVELQTERKKLRIFDATCLLVKKNHAAVEDAFARNKQIIFIGNRNHPECIGTVGRVPDGYCFVVENEEDIKMLPDCKADIISVCQTTLALHEVEKIQKALSRKYPQIKHSDGICFATSERQNAVRKLAEQCDFILIAGSPASANSCRLVQIANECGCKAQLVDNIEDVKNIDFSGCRLVGISAGASTPQQQIDMLVDIVSKL